MEQPTGKRSLSFLPEQPKLQDLAEALSWKALLGRVQASGAARGTDGRVLQAAVQLELERDVGAALARLEDGDLKDPLARWLFHHAVVLGDQSELFDRWLKAEEAALDPQQVAALRDEAELVRVIVHGDLGAGGAKQQLDQIGAEGLARPGIGLGGRLAWQVALVAAQRWEQLAQGLGGDKLDRAVAAHLRGDRLGDRPAQAKLLDQIIDDVPFLPVETLIELAFDAGSDFEPTEILQRRHAALVADGELTAAAEATAAFLAIGGGPAKRSKQALSEAMAAEAWQHLTGLLDRRELLADRAALAAAYTREAEKSIGAMATALRIRAAELAMAADDWDTALATLPTGADGELAPLALRYRLFCLASLGRWAELAGALLDLVTDAADRPALIRVALLFAARQPQLSQALVERAATELTGLAAGDVGRTRALLLAVVRRSGDLELLGRLCGAMVDSVDDKRAAGLLSCFCGVRMLDASLHERAAGAFEQARAQLGEHPELLAGQILASTQLLDWSKTAGALDRLAEFANDDGRAELTRTASNVWWAAGDTERALAMAEKLSAARPGDIDAFKLEAAIHLERGDARATAGALERAAAASSNMEAETLYCAAGELLADPVGDHAAAEAVYRRALDLNPLNPDVLQGLKPLLVQAQRWEELLEVLDSLLQIAPSDEARLKLHLEAMAAGRRLMSRTNYDESVRQGFLDSCDKALELDPGNARVVDSLVYTCSKVGWWDQLVSRAAQLRQTVGGLRGLRRALQAQSEWKLLAEICNELADQSQDPREAASAALQAGDIFLQQLTDHGTAEECYRKAATLDENNSQAWRRLLEVLRSAGRPADMAPVLEQLVRASQASDSWVLRLELARLYTEHLNQPNVAIGHFRLLLEKDPGNVEALRSFDIALKNTDSVAERVRVLERLLQEVHDPEEVLGTLLELGHVYQELRDERGQLGVASKLQRFAERDEAFAFLENIYTSLGRHREQCQLYERLIQVFASQPAKRALAGDLLEKKGEIELTKLKSVADAVNTFTHLLKIRPGDETTLGRLEEILSGIGDWQALVTLFERHADSLQGKQDKVTYLHRAAEIAQRRLGDEAETVRLHERIYSIDPTDAIAFAALQKKLEREHDHNKLVELLLQRAEMVKAPDEQLEYIVGAAGICEKIPNVEQAIALYQRALTLNQSGVEALEALSRIFESIERWEDLLKILKRQIQLGGRPARVALLYFKMGSVMETQYQNDDEAYRYYTEALKVSKNCLPALHGRRDLHARRGEWRKVAQTLEAEAAVWSEAKGKADVLAQAAEVYATKLGDRAQALKHYEQAIRIYPECMPAALALFEHYASQGRYSDAAAWGKVYARRGRATQDRRAKFLIQWGDVLAKLERPAEAAEALVKALRLRPGDSEGLYGLLTLCRLHSDAYDYASAFRELLQDATKREDKTATAILSSAVGVLAEQRGDVDEALGLFRRAVKMAGPKLQMVIPLADLLVKVGPEKEALRLINSCRTEDADFNDWVEATLWLGRYWGHLKGDYGQAAEMFEEALKKQPNLEEVRVDLGRMRLMAGQAEVGYEALSAACNQLASRGADVTLLAQRYHAVGLAANKNKNFKTAESSWRRACEYAPDWPYPYVALSRRMLEQGDPDNAERELKLAEQGIKVRTADVMRAQAEFYARRGHPERATTLYRKAVKLADPEIDDRVNLARYLMRGPEPRQGIDLLMKVIEQRADYVPAYEEMAIGWRSLGEHQRACRAAQAVQLAVGGKLTGAEPPTPMRQLKDAAWDKIAAPLQASPIDALWRVLAEQIAARFAQPAASVMSGRQELVRVGQEVAEMAGLQLGVALNERALVPVEVIGEYLVVSPDVEALPRQEARQVLTMAVAAVKLGYATLIGLQPLMRQTVADALVGLLLPEDQAAEQTAELISSLPGKVKRQLQKVVAQNPVGVADAQRAAESWVANVEHVCWVTALFTTEDLPAFGRGYATKFGISVDWTRDGGLLHALPELQRFARFYVGDEFHRQRAGLGG